jgi:hypothetical protein
MYSENEHWYQTQQGKRRKGTIKQECKNVTWRHVTSGLAGGLDDIATPKACNWNYKVLPHLCFVRVPFGIWKLWIRVVVI